MSDGMKVRITSKGLAKFESLKKTGYVRCSPDDRIAWDVLYDLDGEGLVMSVPSLMYAGKDSALGRRLESWPLFSEDVEWMEKRIASTLSRLISDECVEVVLTDVRGKEVVAA